MRGENKDKFRIYASVDGLKCEEQLVATLQNCDEDFAKEVGELIENRGADYRIEDIAAQEQIPVLQDNNALKLDPPPAQTSASREAYHVEATLNFKENDNMQS